jgi:hypothetical protein
VTDETDTADSGEAADSRVELSRRQLLGGTVAGAVGLAGCYTAVTELDDGAGESGGGGTPTPTFGYGGSPDGGDASSTGTPDQRGEWTPGATETGTRPDFDWPTDTATDTPTATATPSPTPSPTPTATATAIPIQDDFGEQRYGEYGYGGVGP